MRPKGAMVSAMNTTKRLTRSSTDKYVGGVSAGLANHLDIDPTLVRVGWIFGTLVTGGAAIFAYVAMLVVVPRDDKLDLDDRLPGVPA
jgi:phage shock protein C